MPIPTLPPLAIVTLTESLVPNCKGTAVTVLIKASVDATLDCNITVSLID